MNNVLFNFITDRISIENVSIFGGSSGGERKTYTRYARYDRDQLETFDILYFFLLQLEMIDLGDSIGNDGFWLLFN